MNIDKLKAQRRAAINADDLKRRKKGKREYKKLLKKFKKQYRKGYSGLMFDSNSYYTMIEVENMLTADLNNAFYIDARRNSNFSRYDWYLSFKLN